MAGPRRIVVKARLSMLLLASALLAGCPAGIKTPPPAQPTPPVSATPTPGGTVYRVDPVVSEVSILVYRGGALARLGHNHVLSVKSLEGQVAVSPEAGGSSFDLSFPVAQLVVDDAQARRNAGTEFPGEIDQGARDGTRKNMLRAEVLDAEHFPRVSLRAVRVTPPWQAAHALTRITLKDVSREIDVPLSIEVTAGRVTATGQFALRQTDFGIKPFSIGLGALEVVDQLQVRFKVVGNRE